MKIISTNIGEPAVIEWRGKKVKTGIYKFPVSHPIFLGDEDVEDDHVIDRRYHGGKDKACYLYSADHYKYWQQLYPDLDLSWGMFGENLSVEGLHEDDVNVGDIFQIGEVMIQATQPRQPCYKLGIRFGTQKMVRQFVDSGFSGVYVRVLQNGKVKAGDEMIFIEKKNSLSIKDVFKLLYTSDFENEKENFERAIDDPFIADSCRKDLLKRWADHL